MQEGRLTPRNLPEKVKCTSLVYRTLGGRVRSRVLCLSCKKPSDTFDSLLDLSLDIPRNASDLLDLFQHFIHKERLDGDNKYKCDKYVLARELC
jgi:ubiquitin carboxyl-terminal hydrolase 36/42